ncbi:MAG: hypothetical protein ABSG16_12690 [Candidatus Acidiferrum sp.]
MLFTKNLLIGFGAAALLAMLLVVTAPKAVHAAVAALVQVVNTSSNPVPTLEADAATAFVVTAFCNFGAPPGNDCGSDLYSVPGGKTAVLESFSGSCNTVSGSALVRFQLDFTAPGGADVFESIPPSAAIPFSGTVVNSVALNLKSYASGGASGTTIGFDGIANASEDPSTGCVAVLSGHLE